MGGTDENPSRPVVQSYSRTKDWPSFHSMSTRLPPRVRRPHTRPCVQDEGSAGSTFSVPSGAVCSSISAMPAHAPKLPSIWNGGCASKRFR